MGVDVMASNKIMSRVWFCIIVLVEEWWWWCAFVLFVSERMMLTCDLVLFVSERMMVMVWFGIVC